jgi:hypothetical protein
VDGADQPTKPTFELADGLASPKRVPRSGRIQGPFPSKGFNAQGALRPRRLELRGGPT